MRRARHVVHAYMDAFAGFLSLDGSVIDGDQSHKDFSQEDEQAQDSELIIDHQEVGHEGGIRDASEQPGHEDCQEGDGEDRRQEGECAEEKGQRQDARTAEKGRCKTLG